MMMIILVMMMMIMMMTMMPIQQLVMICMYIRPIAIVLLSLACLTSA